ncbi:hypothetical protein CDD83_9953 [Cordyceps sp. RAO-2017]|nr:hypothetical protein CDD83_9953 [Cordyceps sp. RAO-2017]
MSAGSQDDKASICLGFLLEHVEAHRAAAPHRPLFLGLNGLQGVGKTMLVAALAAALQGRGIATLACSIDDFYLTRADQAALARDQAGNALLQHRGEPGTHDVALAGSVFAALMRGRPTKIPRYDKGAFHGRGDRLPEAAWTPVNQPGQAPLQVVILEGWCVGFRPLGRRGVEAMWSAPSRTLCRHRLEHLLLLDDKLAGYDGLTDLLDAFIHLDADDVQHVYGWRLEQEERLRAQSWDPAAGMTPDEVVAFVDAYFPGYELYTDGVRRGVLPRRPGCQLRIVVGRDRGVKQVVRI